MSKTELKARVYDIWKEQGELQMRLNVLENERVQLVQQIDAPNVVVEEINAQKGINK